MTSVTLIDNYDSFTFNLVHYFGALGAEREGSAQRSGAASRTSSAKSRIAIVLSPGPCTPHEAGICLDLIRAASAKIPIFGVCLGHQAIGEAFGGEVVRAPPPDPRQDRRHPPPGRDCVPRLAEPVQGDALSFAGRAPRHACPPNWR